VWITAPAPAAGRVRHRCGETLAPFHDGSAGVIARKAQENEGLAFMAGLLHDIGKIVLASAEGSKYSKPLLPQDGRFGNLVPCASKSVHGRMISFHPL
jgi:hypothetical protein